MEEWAQSSKHHNKGDEVLALYQYNFIPTQGANCQRIVHDVLACNWCTLKDLGLLMCTDGPDRSLRVDLCFTGCFAGN